MIESIGEFKAAFQPDSLADERLIICNSVEEQLNTYLFLREIGYLLNEWEVEFVCANPERRKAMREDYQYPFAEYCDEEDDEDTLCIATSRRSPGYEDINYDDIAHLVRWVLAQDEALQPPDLPGLLECLS